MFEAAFWFIGMMVLVFFGLIAFVVLVVVVFGKRVHKLWEYEAHFSDETGKYVGEFEIEMSKVGKEAIDHTLKAEFEARHESIAPGQSVEVYVDDLRVMQGIVVHAGKVVLTVDDLTVREFEPTVGQTCRVMIDTQERWTADLKLD